jgi:hypothetical protein
MEHVTSDPNQQTGTGEPRSTADGTTGRNDEAKHDDVREPPDEARTTREINRSGSGGSGGPSDGDPGEEGSGSGSLEEILGGSA